MITTEEASAEAVHKTKNAQAAIELARELQINEAVERTAKSTKDALLAGLKEVFGESDDPKEMRVLVRRIPILCTSIEAMHKSIEKIEKNLSRAVWIILTAVLLAFMKLILIP